MTLLLWIIFTFVLGVCVGSFINVLVLRTLRGESFVTGRSHCDTCGRPLVWYELIPLLSYIALRGRCRTCQQEIDVMHPVVEFLTGALFVWWLLIGFAFFQLSSAPLVYIQPLFWLVIGTLLLIIVVIDLRAWLIPDWAILGLSFLTLGYRMTLILAGVYNPQDLARALMGAALACGFFLCLWYATRKQGIGFGDVKLIFALALLIGWPDVIVGVFSAFVIGAVVGVALLFAAGARWKSAVPFAPFLIVGTGVALLWGDSLLRWYLHLL